MLHLFWRGIWNNNFVKDTISCQRILFQRIVFRRYCICILFVCLFVCLFICVVVDCVFNHNNCIVPLSISGELLHGEGRGWTEKSHCGEQVFHSYRKTVSQCQVGISSQSNKHSTAIMYAENWNGHWVNRLTASSCQDDSHSVSSFCIQMRRRFFFLLSTKITLIWKCF